MEFLNNKLLNRIKLLLLLYFNFKLAHEFKFIIVNYFVLPEGFYDKQFYST